MIIAADITRAIDQMLPMLETFDPDKSGIDVKLPLTMRQLLEEEQDFEDWPLDLSNNLDYSINGDRPACVNDVGPLMIRSTKFEAPLELEDYRGQWPLLNMFWRWLNKYRPQHGINIDHLLADPAWPLMIELEEEVNFRGYDLDMISPQCDWEMNSGEQKVYDCFCFLDYYDTDSGDEDYLVVRFFQGVKEYSYISLPLIDSLPEVCFEMFDQGYLERFCEIIQDGISQQDFSCIANGRWVKALEAVLNHEYELYFADVADEGYYYFNDDPDCFENYFRAADAYRKYIAETIDLIHECRKDVRGFWRNLIMSVEVEVLA